MDVGPVMLVDDDRALRDAVSRALRLEGYDVVKRGRAVSTLLASSHYGPGTLSPAATVLSVTCPLPHTRSHTHV